MASLFDAEPGRKNVYFDAESPSRYFSEYARALATAAEKVDPKAIDQFTETVRQAAASKHHVFVIGNGGSSAIADHLCCDFSKGSFHTLHPPIRTHSLSSNTALFSALANDIGYEHVFTASLEIFADPKDVLIAISSSGNSPNILSAVTKAKEVGMKTIGLSGFDGGKLKTTADISLHVPVNNYGIVEDCHQMLMHAVSQVITVCRHK